MECKLFPIFTNLFDSNIMRHAVYYGHIENTSVITTTNTRTSFDTRTGG